MYYSEESFDGSPIGYGLDAGANDVGGGRNQNMSHGMSLHAPLYIPQHMMGMTGAPYNMNVSSSHQMHMGAMNVHSHLPSSSASSLRTSAEISPLPYTQPQPPSLSHRGAPVYHSSQAQPGQIGMTATGPSSSSTQPRVHVPLASNNLSTQWSWPPPMPSKVGALPAQHGQHAHMGAANSGAPAPSLHSHGLSVGSVSSKNVLPNNTSAWTGQPPRSLLANSAGPNVVNDSRFRASPSAVPTSPTKYLPSQGPSSSSGIGSAVGSRGAGSGGASGGPSSTSGGAGGPSQKSVASFAPGKGNFFNYTPSAQMSGAAGSAQAAAALLASSSVASFADASAYVPSSQHHAPSQQLTSSHHFSRPNPMEEYIAASLKRRQAQKQGHKETSPTASAAASPARSGSSSSIAATAKDAPKSPSKHFITGSSSSTSANASAASATQGNNGSNSTTSANSPSTQGLSSQNSSSMSLTTTSTANNTSSATDTTNWQVLDMSNMALVSVSPAISLYGLIRVLYLQHNRLATLPVELCTMPNLACLDVSHNQLVWLPAEIGQLVSLKELMLHHNQLRSLPVEMGRLFRLHKLTLDENPITDLPIEVMRGGAPEIVQHLRTLLAPSDPPPPRSWLLNSAAERIYAMPGYFHGLDALLGPKAVRTVENGHKQVTIQAKDVAKFRVDGSIRTMCYNILADIYAASLNYCPSWALAWSHRKQTIMQEIDTYAPDLLCLQEVVWAQYVHFFQPELEARGFKGTFHPKTRAKYNSDLNRIDGCASFYRASMFEQVDAFNIEFQTTAQENPDRYSTPGDEAGYARLVSKDNIATGLVLRRRDRAALAARAAAVSSSGANGKNPMLVAPTAHHHHGHHSQQRGRTPSPQPPQNGPNNLASASSSSVDEDLLVFVNTHIHWDPEFSDVKLMQVQILMEQLEAWIDEYSDPNRELDEIQPSQRIAMILGGDFNSKPDSGVYQFLVDGFLPGDHPEFLGYTYGDYTESGLKHSLNLMSANATVAGEPAFTNYTVDFNGVLDYIWYAHHNFTVERVLNGVDEHIVHSYNGALPNMHMPSDHIPLVADFVQNINRRG